MEEGLQHNVVGFSKVQKEDDPAWFKPLVNPFNCQRNVC